MEKPVYSIIVPVYNGASTLEALHRELSTFLSNKYAYEVIYVDDCSTDSSWEIIRKFKAASPNISAVRLARNAGQHAATVCGFKYAKGEYCVTMDDDLEVLPAELEKLIAAQKKDDSDVVYAAYPRLNQSFIRKLLGGLYKFASKVEGSKKGKGSSFRLIKRSLAEKIVQNQKHFMFIDEICLWYTSRIIFVDVEPNRATARGSRYGLRGLFSMTSAVIMFSSVFPLKMVTRIGFLLFAVNLFVGIYFIVKKFFFKIDVAGYASLIVSILFSTGLIIFCIGILAQYLAHAIKALNNQPVYHEAEVLC